jgi:hypothetical protein
MDRAPNDPGHIATVDAWLRRSLEHDPDIDIVGLFGVAVEALWSRAVTTLGSVTLTAIAERVLYAATGRYGFLATVNPRPNGDSRWKQHLHERLTSVPRSELIEGLRYTLIEVLTVIGRLTAEILSDELHGALVAVSTSTSNPDLPKGVHSLPAVFAGKTLS